MSKSKTPDLPNQPSFNVSPRDIGDEMKSSYIDYAMSVIVGRALPDVRDGLKPVHRRILYTMDEMGLRHNKPFRKCAKIVGEVLGKYHPHGDGAVYDALVRMAQDFSLLSPLVDGQGNFGSIDGDPPAAYRYTEARLKAVSNELLADIDKETVDWAPTYDNSSYEPSVLPAKLPNLLLNGSTGIAVGMATNVPPHALAEICDAVTAYIENPQITVGELLKIIKGPDFPTGGIVRGRSGIKSYFTNGRGSVRIQARTDIQPIKGGRDAIIVTELPYMVNKAKLIENIADLVRAKKVPDIADIRDESDRRGMRIVIEVKREGNANVVLNQLWKHTQLESTFGVIMLALVDGRPKVLGMREMLKAYVGHRKEVVTRRTKYILKKAMERAHILEGFLIALDNIDKVIKIIRGSSNAAEAKGKLVKSFKNMTLVQAQAILDMRLHQLTRLSVDDIKKEYAELQKRIKECRAILADVKRVLKIIVDEIGELKEKYGEKRRTEITAEGSEMKMEDLIAEEEVVISLSNVGYIKRTPSAIYRTQGRGGKGVKGMTTKEDDFIEHLYITSSHATILFFSSKGSVYALKAYEIPESSRSARGKAIVNLLPLGKEERVTSAIAIRSFEEAKAKESYLFMATRNGTVKKVPLTDFSNIRRSGIKAILLEEGDVLVEVARTRGDGQIIMGTAKGMCIRFSEEDARPMGRTAKGVKGIRLQKDDRVIGLEVASPTTPEGLLTVCRQGYGKRTSLKEYRGQKRGGGGIITIRATERNGDVVGIKLVTDFDDLMVITEKGMTIRLHCKDIKTISRNTQGVRIVRLKSGDQVARVAPIADDTYHGPEKEQED